MSSKKVLVMAVLFPMAHSLILCHILFSQSHKQSTVYSLFKHHLLSLTNVNSQNQLRKGKLLEAKMISREKL